MITLDELSRIGFGAYRISPAIPDHREALSYALECGCNLVDTAASYSNGASEALVGEVAADKPVFVMTKVGYVNGVGRDLLADLVSHGLPREEIVETDETSFCIHPDYISAQALVSRARLRRKQLDCLFLHNPERLMDAGQPSATEILRDRIRRAFVRMEELAANGVLRFYGVSSNALVSDPDSPGVLNVETLIEVARSIGGTSHFKFIQFPFNLVETGAISPRFAGASVVEAIRRAGLVPVGNRPLNAISPSGPVRLATYERQLEHLDERAEEDLFEDCLARMDEQLDRLGRDEKATDFSVVQFLRDGRRSVSTPELVTQIFQTHFFPFIQSLYDGEVPADDGAAFVALEQAALLYAKRANLHLVESLRSSAQSPGRIAGDSRADLAVSACEFVLASGIPHVLVGMRRKEYVEQLRPLF